MTSEGEADAKIYNVRPVSGEFEVEYTVGHGAYTIELVCGTEVLVRRVVHYPNELKPGGVVQLGSL
ncbi:Uncharacterised protein [Halioglobus japonicus]|nr:Uncharacterised protein [Halioglobus japonicus]